MMLSEIFGLNCLLFKHGHRTACMSLFSCGTSLQKGKDVKVYEPIDMLSQS